MINLKPSVLIVSMIAAAVVGGVASCIVLNVLSSNPKTAACEPAAGQGKNTQRHGDLVNTGRDKGY
jgi:hypothetical protein